MEQASGNTKAANGTLLAGVYGPAKTYKTTGALLIPPALRPVAYLETERKGSAQHRLRLLTASAQQRAGLVEEVPPEAGEWCGKDLEFFWPSPATYYEDLFQFATVTANEFKFVIIDSGSTMADGIMKQALTLDYPGSKGRVTLGTGSSATKHPQPSDYGFVQDRYMTILQALDACKAHVLLISHDKVAEIRDDSTKKLLKVFGGPRSSGNALLEVVPAIMDLILRLEPKQLPQVDGAGKFTGKILSRALLRTTNHGEGVNGTMYPCGDRLGLFKDGEMWEPVKFWERVAGYLGAK